MHAGSLRVPAFRSTRACHALAISAGQKAYAEAVPGHFSPIFFPEGAGFSRLTDLRSLIRSTQDSNQFGSSSASFLPKAMAVRKIWRSEVCGRGRLCASPLRWNRVLFAQPPNDDSAPAKVSSDFDSGRPWHTASLVN